MAAQENIFLSDENVPPEWQTSAFLGAVLHVMPSLVYVFNQKTMSNEYANRSIGMALGYSQKEVAAMGSELMPTICHPDDLPKVLDHLQSIRELDDYEVAELEYRVRHKDGHIVWLLGHDAVFERDRDGSVIRHIGNASDVSHQKASEERAISEGRQATTATEDLCAFAYSISHDMRSPSNTVLMLLSEVMEQHGNSMPEDAQYLIDLAIDSVKRMQARIGDVLDMSRLLDRNTERSAVPLRDVVQAVQLELSAEICSCACQIDVASLPVVRASQPQMFTLFQNLISNALKYRAPGRAPQIEIWDSSAADDDDYVEITVRDNGIGIPQAERKQVFDMFRRLHLQTEHAGNGLGLAICRRIVTSHDGEIWIEAAPNTGSDFKLRLKR